MYLHCERVSVWILKWLRCVCGTYEEAVVGGRAGGVDELFVVV